MLKLWKYEKQAEAEVVPSSSSVKVRMVLFAWCDLFNQKVYHQIKKERVVNIKFYKSLTNYMDISKAISPDKKFDQKLIDQLIKSKIIWSWIDQQIRCYIDRLTVQKLSKLSNSRIKG